MKKASTFQVGRQLRGLVVTLRVDGGPAPKPWRQFEDHLLEDLRIRLTTQDVIQHVLRDIDLKIQVHGKSNVQVNLPRVVPFQIEFERMKTTFRPEDQISFTDEHELLLTLEQRVIYETVLTTTHSKKVSL